MLRLNVNEEKRLTFEVQIGGVNYDNVISTFKLVLNEVEYGFPAKVGRETITVDLPPLNKIIGAKISEGDEAEVRLELIADGHYLTPWQDNARLSNPLVIEAKIKDDSFKPNPSLKTRLVVSEDGARQKTVVEEKTPEEESEEDLTERIVSRLSEKFERLLSLKEKEEMPPMKDEGEDDKEAVEEKSCVKKEADNEEEKEKDEEEMEESAAQALERLMNKTLDTFGLNESGDRKKKKDITLEEFKKNLTEEDVKRYIAAKCSKNPKVQEIIYEQAKLSAKKDTPAHILKEAVKMIRKK